MWSSRKLAKEIGNALFGLVLLGATALIGVGWLTFALYCSLETSQGAPLSAAITGLVAIAPLAALGLWSWKDAFGNKADPDIPTANLVTLAPRIAATVESLARRRPIEAVIVCLLLGFTAARRPGQIFDLLLSLGGLAPEEPHRPGHEKTGG